LGDPRDLPETSTWFKVDYTEHINGATTTHEWTFDGGEWETWQGFVGTQFQARNQQWYDRLICPQGDGPVPGPYGADFRTEWYIDFTGDLDNRGGWHTGAPAGDIPLFYHVYKDENYYYIQYWYFLVSNDIINQTYEDTFHEGEWEHVAIRFTIGDEEDESTWIPDLVNFYQHYYTVTVDAADCWWAPDGEPSEAEVLFDPDERTHLQIFIALNAHASYNRFQARYELDIADVEHYTDVLDYTTLEGSYFDYDYLINMGEPQNFLDTEVHVHTQGQTPYNYYDYHYVDDDSYPEFLSMSEETFFGKDFYAGGFGPITVETKPPHSPVVTGMGDGDPNVWTVFANGFNNGNNDHELVGTWDYRSVWLADPQNISVNTTWTTNQELDNPIIVTGGATLTIDKEGFLISTRGFWPQKIIIEDGSIVITENSSGQFSNIQLILMDNGEQDNTSQIRNISFTHYQRNIRHSLIVHKTLMYVVRIFGTLCPIC